MPGTTAEPQASSPLPRSSDRFVARQPILDVSGKTVAYELLFRSGTENYFAHDDADEASTQLIHSSLLDFGLDRLTAGKKAFINVTGSLLLGRTIRALPPDEVVLEILETVKPDNDVLAACFDLKRLGYEIALDDFVSYPELEPLVALADIVKVDFLATHGKEREKLSADLHARSIQLLAEKVEDHDEFADAQRLGYSYFQGYFFCRPEVTTARSIPTSKMKYMDLLREVNRKEIDVDRITTVIQSEVSLSMKLLRYINSWAVAVPYEVRSIQQAVMLLGSTKMRKWGSLIAAACMCEDKPRELLVLCLVRARFNEMVAPRVGLGDDGSALFLTGLLSGVDALLDCPLPEVLGQVSLHEDVKNALLGGSSAFAGVHELALALECGDWEKVSALGEQMRIPEPEISVAYRSATDWADEVLSLEGL